MKNKYKQYTVVSRDELLQLQRQAKKAKSLKMYLEGYIEQATIALTTGKKLDIIFILKNILAQNDK